MCHVKIMEKILNSLPNNAVINLMISQLRVNLESITYSKVYAMIRLLVASP